MNKIYLTILIILTYNNTCHSQLNNLDETEFDNIKFGNITINQIYNSNANLANMQTLFGVDIQSQINTSGPFLSRDLWNDKIFIGFEDESGTGTKYSPTYIFVKDSSISVTVKNITVKIGDNINAFGNNIAINTKNADYSVVFTDQSTGSISLAFKIDSITNKIIEIKFITF